MPILHSEILIAGLRVRCSKVSYSFHQSIDEIGRPSSTVVVGLLNVVLSGVESTWPIWEALMLDSYRRESGHIIFYQGENHSAKRLTFYDAALVGLTCQFDARGKNGTSSLKTELHFSAAAENVQGQHIEAHSLIPWESNSPTSFKALTKPSDPPPSLHLRAIPSPIASTPITIAAIPRPPVPRISIQEIGRMGKQEHLRDLVNNPKVGSSIKGWITQDINEINQNKRRNIRNPPGMDLAHERGREAAKGYSYQYSNLQNRDLHRRQHKFDDKGRRNRERPDPEHNI